MSSPRRHHYLPQFYLRGFCRDDAFWIFDRERNEFRIQTPINTTVQTHYYSFQRKDGTLDTKLESYFSEIDSLTAPIIAKTEGREQLSLEEKHLLSVFVALQKSRVPDFEKRHDELRQGILERLAGNVAPATDKNVADEPSAVPAGGVCPTLP